jgi:hypothetical protein
MNMKCEEVDIKMIDYLDRNLEDGEHREIEKHLETCERCLDELNECQKVMNQISREEMVKPQDSLRINFYHMLHSEIRKSRKSREDSIHPVKSENPWYNFSRYRIAAAIAFLICGTFIGMLINSSVNNSRTSAEFRQLQSEVYDLRKTTMFTMLKAGSSSDRIQAVSFADDLGEADANVTDILIRTLNNDKNVNVRLAAAYALSKFADQRAVSDSLVRSLSIQNDPILQITLISILAERKEKRALQTIQEIIANKNTLNEVRTVAQNSLRVLI